MAFVRLMFLSLVMFVTSSVAMATPTPHVGVFYHNGATGKLWVGEDSYVAEIDWTAVVAAGHGTTTYWDDQVTNGYVAEIDWTALFPAGYVAEIDWTAFQGDVTATEITWLDDNPWVNVQVIYTVDANGEVDEVIDVIY